MTDDKKITLTEENFNKMNIFRRLSNISIKELYNAKLWYDGFKKWILTSEEYAGDGHYLINARRRLLYTVDDNSNATNEDWYGFNQEQIDELERSEYYPLISIPEDEYFYQSIKPFSIQDYSEFDIGITIQNNIPTVLFYHGYGFVDKIDQGATTWNEFPRHVCNESIIFESVMSSTLGLLGKNWSHKLEYCSNDSWTEPIPAVVFELPYEEWLINWLLPEASEDKDTIQKNDDNPERKDLNDWKEQVKDRDNVCIVCGDEKHLECHHVYPFGLYPKLRDDVNNGVVLCRWCHRRYHSHYGKEERVNPSTLMQFVQRFGTGATQSHVTTVEHVEQVLKDDVHMSKKGKLEQIIEIIKGYNQDDQPCTMVELFKDSNLTMLKLEELLDALAVKGVVYQFPEGQYHVA
jgi:predicted transcriptional regulator